MTLFEKVKNSKSSTIFTLYKEGLFYKCYNQNAMAFVKRVKLYKVSTKYVKSLLQLAGVVDGLWGFGWGW